MTALIAGVVASVIRPVLSVGALDVVIPSLLLFVVGWAVFSLVIGRRD